MRKKKRDRKDRAFSKIIAALVLVVLLALFFMWFFGLPNPEVMDASGMIEKVSDETFGVPDELRVMSFNIHYGKGQVRDEEESPPKDDFDSNIEEIAEILRSNNIDIAALQEIDFYSKRSYYTDQAERIAELAGFSYIARIVNWDVKYVPYPFFSLHHFGRIKSGQAILSKYPIKKNMRYLLQKPESNSWFYNLFYLNRALQIAEIEIGERTIKIGNAHLEAYDKETRQEQAKHVMELLAEDTESMILMGDFNAEKGSKEITMMYAAGLVDSQFELGKENELTYIDVSTNEPKKRLDYIWTTPDLEISDFEVPFSIASDHLPVVVNVE